MKIKLADIVFDQKLYPRIETNWLTEVNYADAMKTGAKFPPIEVVALAGGKWACCDGWHRIGAAKRAGLDSIEAIVSKAKTEAEQFLRAIETNLTHGRGLSPYEKARIVERLHSAEFKWSQSKIAGFLHMTKASLSRMIKKRSVLDTNGFGFGKMHKAPLANLVAAGEVSAEAESAEASLATESQAHIFVQALALMEGGIVDFEDANVCEVILSIGRWVRENGLRLKEGAKKAA
jgi:hypothetical protein